MYSTLYMSFADVTSEKFFDKAYRIATSYGFEPAHKFVDRHRRNKRRKIATYHRADSRNLNNLATLLQFFFERVQHHSEECEPLYIFYSNIDRETKSVVTRSKKPDEAYFTLSIIGIDGPYAEALLMYCTDHIFRELRSKQHQVRINSMGSRDDSKEYFSRFSKTIKKMAQKDIPPECRRMLDKSEIVGAHSLLYAGEQDSVTEYITPTLRLLSDSAQSHFEKIIEYLEAHRLSYELAPDLVELTKYGLHTVFEIQSEYSPVYAHGGRYDTLPHTLYRRRVPVASVTISLPEKTVGSHTITTMPRKPKIFFCHAGSVARLRSLHVLSQLCDANISVAHRLHHPRVGDQLNQEAQRYPYVIIFGQEEAANNVVCIRKTDTRASNFIHINGEALKNIKEFIRS